MDRLRRWILPVSAFILIVGAAATIVWLSRPYAESPLPLRQRPLNQPRLAEDGSIHRTTYRFLFPSEKQAVPGKLTLGRFLGGRLCEGATWEFEGIDQWHGWAPSLFEKETQWVAEEQPGWRISQWLSGDENSAYGRSYLFWSIQALRCLDPESFANEIDMIEHSSSTVTIRLTEGPSSYDYETDTLCWNPVSAADRPGVHGPGQTPLVTLAHELNHAWHDLCRNGDCADSDGRERLALMAENRIRHLLFLKDPTCSQIRPRLKASASGNSPEQGWRNYRDAMNR